MLQSQIIIGGLYVAKISGRLTTVRVDRVESRIVPMGYLRTRTETTYFLTNLRTGRRTTCRSASKFRHPAVRKGGGK